MERIVKVCFAMSNNVVSFTGVFVLEFPAGVPRQGDARGGRRGDDDVGNIQVLVAQDGGLVVAAAADTHF